MTVQDTTINRCYRSEADPGLFLAHAINTHNIHTHLCGCDVNMQINMEVHAPCSFYYNLRIHHPPYINNKVQSDYNITS